MFDIGFSELLLIGVVALIVIGPERLPKVARTAGAWLGRLNRYVSEVKGDIDREMRLEELRKMQQEMKDAAQKYEIQIEEGGQTLKREADQVERVMQAMAATDGGLALREYEKIKAEETAAATEPPSQPEEAKPVEDVPADLNDEVRSDDMTPPAETPAAQDKMA